MKLMELSVELSIHAECSCEMEKSTRMLLWSNEAGKVQKGRLTYNGEEGVS